LPEDVREDTDEVLKYLTILRDNKYRRSVENPAWTEDSPVDVPRRVYEEVDLSEDRADSFKYKLQKAASTVVEKLNKWVILRHFTLLCR
jgi:hypothetical protein